MQEINYIKKICDTTIMIRRCVDDINYLCDILNSIDKNIIREYYKSNKSGVIIDIRKEIAKYILLDDITPEVLLETIKKHKDSEPQRLKAWVNPYKILHPLINLSLVDIDKFVENFVCEVKERIGDVKTIIWNFNGAQHQGQVNYCFALYNKDHKSQSDGSQILLDFNNGLIKYGIWNEPQKEYLVGPFEMEHNEFNITDFYKFVDDNKDRILEEKITPKMTYIDASKLVLEQNKNIPMSSNEIWKEIEKQKLVSTTGSTPWASLNTILLGASVNSTLKDKNPKHQEFKIVGSNPQKFQLVNYMPKHIKESLLDNGFITIEMLKEILLKNNINIEI